MTKDTSEHGDGTAPKALSHLSTPSEIRSSCGLQAARKLLYSLLIMADKRHTAMARARTENAVTPSLREWYAVYRTSSVSASASGTRPEGELLAFGLPRELVPYSFSNQGMLLSSTSRVPAAQECFREGKWTAPGQSHHLQQTPVRCVLFGTPMCSKV